MRQWSRSRARRAWDAGAVVHGRGSPIESWQADIWTHAVDSLELRPGTVVLDLGCGTGNGFPALRAAVGETGRIVGIDVSPKMLARAQARIDDNGWTNIELREVDASAVDLEAGRYDAALASLSLSTVPDLAAAVDRVHTALRPGGRLFFVDTHFRPGPPRLLRLLYRLLTGANGDDVLAAARARFAAVEPVGPPEDRAPFGDRAWPPVVAGLATKAG